MFIRRLDMPPIFGSLIQKLHAHTVWYVCSGLL